MKTRAKSPRLTPSVQRAFLWEDAVRSRTPCDVDREAGVIKRVKVLGWESTNGRRYPPEVAKKAVARGLYENARVYWNHPEPDKRHLTRDGNDAVGILRGVVWEQDGVYGDLHYFKSDERTLRLCEDCERGLAFFGMSHHAECEFERGQDGVVVITEIKEVRSVDVVGDDAGTVNSLWESRTRGMKMKLAAFFEALTRHPKLTKKQRATLLEMDDAMLPAEAEMDTTAEPEAMDPDEALKGGFSAACDAVLKGSGGTAEKVKRIKELLTAQEKLTGGGGGGAGTATEVADDSDDEDDSDDGPSKTEGRKRRKTAGGKAVTLTEADARGLCEFAGVTADARVLGLMTSKTFTEARSVLELARNAKPALAATPDFPRSVGPGLDFGGGKGQGPVTEGRGGQQAQAPADPDEARAARVARLRNGG